eukprot:6637568-Ditylum_brightwellii.AAC.1
MKKNIICLLMDKQQQQVVLKMIKMKHMTPHTHTNPTGKEGYQNLLQKNSEPISVPSNFIHQNINMEPKNGDLHLTIDPNDQEQLRKLEKERTDMKDEICELTKVKVHECWLAYLRTNPNITYNSKPLSNFKHISKVIIEAMYRTTLYAELVHVLEITVFG